MKETYFEAQTTCQHVIWTYLGVDAVDIIGKRWRFQDGGGTWQEKNTFYKNEGETEKNIL